jgi:hypothetical protein
LSQLRAVCARVAEGAGHVDICPAAIAAYATTLPRDGVAPGANPCVFPDVSGVEERCAFWFTLEAINFGSGWTRAPRWAESRRCGLSVAESLGERLSTGGPWSARELARIDAEEVGRALGRDPRDELTSLFACSLRDLGRRVNDTYGGRFTEVVDAADGSVVSLLERVGGWLCFADAARYEAHAVPFLARAQRLAGHLSREKLALFSDLGCLTIPADHQAAWALRLEGILRLSDDFQDRIDHGELIDHGSFEEVELRACAVDAVERILATRPELTSLQVAQFLGSRVRRGPHEPAREHRCRCTAY